MAPRLARIDWPDFGVPAHPPLLSLEECEARLAAVGVAMADRGLEALAVYGDREHAANLAWLTGFDPRFEEALLVVTAGTMSLMVGNECLPYAHVSPLVAAGRVDLLHVPSLSLVSQPREGLRVSEAIKSALPKGVVLGTAGWKYFGPDEMSDPDAALDLPAFLADPLRTRAGSTVNATDLFMHPGHGLRARVSPIEIARLEFANHMAAKAVTRMAHAFREGMTDFEAYAAAAVGGLPLGCHPTLATGARAEQGMSGPTGQVLRRGVPISFNICHWGANVCRSGWLAATADDLPDAARDYVEVFAGPYVEAMSDWCAMMRPGIAGGAVWGAMRKALPYDTFAVTLNPGHLIGIDEWMSSPVAEGSDVPLASGMAMQMDVIPVSPRYGSTRMEDGYVIADADLRDRLAAAFPDVAERCGRRAAFMREAIGMEVPEDLLPLADTCGIVAPFLLSPDQVIVLT